MLQSAFRMEIRRLIQIRDGIRSEPEIRYLFRLLKTESDPLSELLLELARAMPRERLRGGVDPYFREIGGDGGFAHAGSDEL